MQRQFQPILEEAVRLHNAGRLGEAEERYRQVLATEPDHIEAMQRLSFLLHRTGRTGEAIRIAQRAVQLSPDTADSHANLGSLLASEGMLGEAIESFGNAVRLRPEIAQLHFHLANALRQAGRLEESAAATCDALDLREDWPEAWNHLGIVLSEMKQSDRALNAFSRAITLRPNWAEAQNNFAIALHRQGEVEVAIAAYRQAVTLEPGNPDYHNNLSAALQESGAHAEALTEAHAALSLKPSDPNIVFNLGNALRNLGRSQEALEAYQKAISLRPDFAEGYYNLGSALRDVQRLDDALRAFEKAIELRPRYGEAFGNLAAVLRDKGELDLSIANYRKAAELTALPWVAGNLLYTLHFHPDYDSRRIYQEHVKWNEAYAKAAETASLSAGLRVHNTSENGRIRIGYISCDFRNHPVGRFMLPLLSHHDRDRFEVYCYSDTLRPDSFSNELRSHVDVWRNTLGLKDHRFAELVRGDRIDILVDLSMHARIGRMMALATKPAPIQVTYLAYCSTSGLRTMDYRLSDPYLDPPGSDMSVYFEKTIRLKSYWCYPGAPFDVPVGPLPGRTAGRVTFGCLNIFAKVTPPALLTWFEILRRVPNSRLMIHAMEGDHRARVAALAESEGVDPGRVEFIGFLAGARYFEQYKQIDIALDPFPYGGGTTTCDALWMGVPVVSLSGDTAVSRAGLSILSTLGLSRLATNQRDKYVQLAVDLAGNLDDLAHLRSTLRRTMATSLLMDAAGFARDVEAAYLQMCSEWNATAIPHGA